MKTKNVACRAKTGVPSHNQSLEFVTVDLASVFVHLLEEDSGHAAIVDLGVDAKVLGALAIR
jgi:hypothetical protein